jgi:SAM-dependent MidA family methyltransferase
MEPILVRRPAEPFDPSSPGSSEPLVERIRAEIAATGPMTFARFMTLALADPAFGYYATTDQRTTGPAGDFLTAPDTHPIFGWTLARVVEEAWSLCGSPAEFALHEFGPGTGSLAVAILREFDRDGSSGQTAIRYAPHDITREREERIRARVRSAGYPAAVDSTSQPEAGLVIANEFLDALPVHRVELRRGHLRERFVDVRKDELVDTLGDPSTPALAERLATEGVNLAEGQSAEICLMLDDWAAEVVALLPRGVVLVIDYGAAANELYDPRRRRDGTLLAYARHHAHTSLLANVGRQDLTAHVDLTALEQSLSGHGFVPLGRTTQAELLVRCGLEAQLERIRSDPSTGIDEWAAVRSAVARLLDPRATGRFAALGFARGLAPDARLPALATAATDRTSGVQGRTGSSVAQAGRRPGDRTGPHRIAPD